MRRELLPLQPAASALQPPAETCLEGIEVVELKDRQPRQLTALRAHIDELLADDWLIASRRPFTLRRGLQVCHVRHGVVISNALI